MAAENPDTSSQIANVGRYYQVVRGKRGIQIYWKYQIMTGLMMPNRPAAENPTHIAAAKPSCRYMETLRYQSTRPVGKMFARDKAPYGSALNKARDAICLRQPTILAGCVPFASVVSVGSRLHAGPLISLLPIRPTVESEYGEACKRAP